MANTSHRRPRGLASTTLKGAGLINVADRDEKMYDLTKSTQGGRKSQPRNKKIGHRQRAVDIYKTSGTTDPQKMFAAKLQALSNPLAVRGAATKSAARSRKPGQPRKNAVEVYREFVQRRWNPETRFLNLEYMIDDNLLKEHNVVPPGAPGSNQREIPVIFKLASQLKPAVQTISLAHNNLRTGMSLASLPHYLPKLVNLSLQNNQLKTWKDIDYICGRKQKMECLREIILIDNPIRDFEVRNDRLENYRSEMLKRFPTLELLDHETVAKITFDTPVPSSSSSDPYIQASTSFPLPMSPSFITGVDGSLISNFLSRFFPLFDSQRSALSSVYAYDATFSYCVDTSFPARARLRGFHLSKDMPNQRKLEWTPWLHNNAGGSRNLNRDINLDQKMRSLHTGPQEIITAMSALPPTKHDVSGSPDKFCIDAWPITQHGVTVLFLCVHGEFAEAPSGGIRSFNRSFILAPVVPGSQAASDNWDVTILSDQLTVRSYSSHEAWMPGELRVQGERMTYRSSKTELPPPPPLQPPQYSMQILPPEIQDQLNTLPEPQRSCAFAIMQRTGLTVEFSLQCLDMNHWDIESAVASFEAAKPTLPRIAFLPFLFK